MWWCQPMIYFINLLLIINQPVSLYYFKLFTNVASFICYNYPKNPNFHVFANGDTDLPENLLYHWSMAFDNFVCTFLNILHFSLRCPVDKPFQYGPPCFELCYYLIISFNFSYWLLICASTCRCSKDKLEVFSSLRLTGFASFKYSVNSIRLFQPVNLCLFIHFNNLFPINLWHFLQSHF